MLERMRVPITDASIAIALSFCSFTRGRDYHKEDHYQASDSDGEDLDCVEYKMEFEYLPLRVRGTTGTLSTKRVKGIKDVKKSSDLAMFENGVAVVNELLDTNNYGAENTLTLRQLMSFLQSYGGKTHDGMEGVVPTYEKCHHIRINNMHDYILDTVVCSRLMTFILACGKYSTINRKRVRKAVVREHKSAKRRKKN
jgi:hypothetical protein